MPFLCLRVYEVVGLAVLEFDSRDTAMVNGDGFDDGVDEILQDGFAHGLGQLGEVDVFAQPHSVPENELSGLRYELLIKEGWGYDGVGTPHIQLGFQ